jgi:hypothetical protein
VRRLLAVLALGVALLVLTAPEADAIDIPDIPGIDVTPDCKTAPTPEMPGRGIAGFFESAPDPLPAPADPFTADPSTTITQQYGYAGLRWNTYDLGCGPSLIRDPGSASGTQFADWILTFPRAAVALTGATFNAALDPGFLGMLDPMVAKVVDGLRVDVFERWYLIPTCAGGLLLILLARKQRIAESALMVAGTILVMGLAVFVFRWPLVAPQAADQSISAVLGSVAAGLNGQAPGSDVDAGQGATAAMHDALLYQTWLAGTFGSADSQVAKDYGPTIFRATALTWSEAQTVTDDPDAGRTLIEAKQKQFKDAAAQIQAKDPDAYDYLTGRRSDDRVGYAVLASLATLCVVPFIFMAALLVIGALVIVRFGVMLLPLFACLALYPRLRAPLVGLLNTVVVALINAAIFGIGAIVFVTVMGPVLTAGGMALWLRLIVVLVMTVAAWVALRPYRRLTQMASGRDSFREAVGAPGQVARAVGRRAGQAAGALITAAATGGAAGAVAGKAMGGDTGPAAPARVEGDGPPVIVHQPAVEAGRPPVVAVTVTDLAQPAGREMTGTAPAITASRPVGTPGPTPPDPGLPPARVEGYDSVDWHRHEQELTEPEEPK